MEKSSKKNLSLNPIKIFNESLIFYQEKFKILIKISLITTTLFFLLNKLNSFIFNYFNKPKDIYFLILYLSPFFFLNLILISIRNLLFIYAINEKKDFFLKNYIEKLKSNFKNYLIIILITNLISLIGLIFFVIPGIFFYVNFVFSGFIIALEKEESIKKALSKSLFYAKGNFIKLSLCLFFILITSLFIEMVISINSRILNSKIFEEFFIYFKNLLFNPLNIIYLFLIYKKIKSSKE